MQAQKDRDPEVRKAAGEALAAMGPGEVGDVPACGRHCATRRRKPIAPRAAAASGALGPAAALPFPTSPTHSVAGLARPPRRHRRIARMGPDAKGTVIDLEDALSDKDEEVRRSRAGGDRHAGRAASGRRARCPT